MTKIPLTGGLGAPARPGSFISGRSSVRIPPLRERALRVAAFGVQGVVPVNLNVCQTVTTAGGRYQSPIHTLLLASVSWSARVKRGYLENKSVCLGHGASKTSGPSVTPVSWGRRVSRCPCAGADTVSQVGCH